MDILFTMFSLIGLFLSLMLTFVWLDYKANNNDENDAGYAVLFLFVISALGLTWAQTANSYHKPSPIITYHPIEELHNIPFYINENGRPVEVTGDARFADPKLCQIKITIVPGGWKFCMYVTETRVVELVKKEVEVELK